MNVVLPKPVLTETNSAMASLALYQRLAEATEAAEAGAKERIDHLTDEEIIAALCTPLDK